jgi:inhibitor of cysteine peptidase
MSELNLTYSDSGRSFEVSSGDLVQVRLQEHGATGYQWAISEMDPDILELEHDDYVPPGETVLGAPGERVLTFRAKARGSAQIALKNWREWEGDSSIHDRFGVTVMVKE